MEKMLQRAKVSGQPVMIMYLSKKGLVTKRLVSVEKMTNTVMYGFCYLRKGKRSFLLDNMLAVLPASKYEINQFLAL